MDQKDMLNFNNDRIRTLSARLRCAATVGTADMGNSTNQDAWLSIFAPSQEAFETQTTPGSGAVVAVGPNKMVTLPHTLKRHLIPR